MSSSLKIMEMLANKIEAVARKRAAPSGGWIYFNDDEKADAVEAVIDDLMATLEKESTDAP